jgi:hypothetical protein
LPEKRNRKNKAGRYPDEETWLREFVGYHGTDCVTVFYEGNLGGVSLTLVIEAVACGTVVSSEKCNGPGTICEVQYRTEDGESVLVTVHFVSNEEQLTLLSAEVEKERGNETDHAA